MSADAYFSLLGKVLETSPVGMLRATREGRILYANQRLSDMLGLAKDELLGSHVERIYFDPEDRRALLERLHGQGFLRDAEVRLRHSSGRMVHALVSTVEVEAEDARDAQRVTWVYDQTERLEMHERIRALAEERNHLLQNVQVGIALTGDGRILSCNPRLLENFGYATDADIVGKPSAVMFRSAEDYARISERVGPALAAGKTVDLEWPMQRADGTEVWMHIAAKPLRDAGPGYRTVWMLADIDARKRAEAALQAAAEEQRRVSDRLKALFDSSPVGVVIRRPSTNVVEYANAAVLRMLGYSFEQFAAMAPAKGYVEPAVRASIIEEVQRTGRALGREVAYRRADGGVFWALVSFEIIEWQGGPAMVSWLADITARKEAEAAVRAAGEEQHALLESATAGIAFIKDRVVQRCNGRLEQIFGYGPGELAGMPTRAWYAEEGAYRSFGEQAYPRLARGETYTGEWQFLRKDRTSFWCRVSGRAFDAAQPAQGSVWMLEDVTAEHADADALKQALARLEAIFETATSGMALVTNRVFVKCNRRLEEIFGQAPGALEGQSSRRLYTSDEEYEKGGTQVYAQLARGETHRREQQVQRADGTTFWARFSGRAIDASDLSRGTVWSIADVTEERAAAEALRIAKEAAEAATEAKSTFLATMSHEIRTPMTGVLGMLELLQRTRLDSAQRELTDVIRDSASSLLKVIDDVLDFSKIESGRLDIECVPMSTLALAEGVAEVLAPEAHKKRLRLMAFVDASVPPMVGGDPVRLRQILFNIVGNAIKFTERGEVVVRIAVDAPAPGGMVLRAQVTDSGIGITPEAQARLFQPFVQADGSTTRRFGGTGLGLSICRRLVERMGGAIGVASMPGGGSTFWFTMPVSPSDVPAPAEPDLSGLRILIVDDHRVAGDALQTYLSAAGAEVEVVQSAASALELVRRHTAAGDAFHALVASQTLTGMDAFALRGALDADTELKATPCLLLAPYEEVGQRRRALEAGFAAHLACPVRRSALLRAVAASCGRTEALAEDANAPAEAAVPEPPDRDAALAAGRLILVAEDNVTNQLVVMRQLAQLGHAADLAEDGKRAFERFRTTPYGLVLADIHMPSMDGLELTAAIRGLEQAERRRRAPIIAFTADVLTSETQRYLAAGVDDLIRKPFSLAQLDEILARWLLRAAPRVEAAGPAAPAVSAAAAEVLSLEALRTSLGRIDGTALALLDRYVETTAPLIAEIGRAIAARSVAEARRAAHSALGASRSAGAGELAALCADLERAVIGEAWEDAAALGKRLEPALARVREAVKRLRA